MRYVRELLTVAFVVQVAPVWATVRNVPADYPTIQSAINSAVSTDTILVAPGNYFENISFQGKAIRLFGAGASSTTLSPANAVSTLIQVAAGEGVGTEVAHLTLKGGSMKHVILVANGAQPRIHECVIRDHISFEANATEIGSYDSSPSIEFNLIIHNRSIGGVGVFSGSGLITNNTFHDNSRGFWSQGSAVVARNNIVTNSVQFGVGDYRFLSTDYNCVFNNNPNYDYGATPGPNDFSVWPEYCDTSADEYGLDAISACLGSGEGGAHRGALGQFCGTDIGPRAVALTVSGGQVSHVTDSTPEISWTYFDPGGYEQTECEIEVGIDSEWSVAEMWDPPPFIDAAAVWTYAGLELSDGTDYIVRVRVHNGVEWGLWSYRTFHTNTPPPVPTLLQPADSAIIPTNNPVLTVSSSPDAEGDSESFNYEVYADELLANLILASSNRPASWAVSPSLTAENQAHWWRARAHDGFEQGDWSQPRMFLLDAQNSPPIAGPLIEPVGNIAIPTTAPHFDWNEATDPDPGQNVFSQALIVATDANFFFSTQIPSLPSSEFTFPGLQVAQRYWWKVRFTDADGLTVETPAAQFFIPGPGDMNLSFSLSVVDLVMVIDVVFRGIPAPAATYLVDVDGNCAIDVLDVIELINHVFRSGPTPLAPCDHSPGALRVPSEFPTINGAILVAPEGSTILVAPGLYIENIDFLGKAIILRSESGPEGTYLTPENIANPTIRFISGESPGTVLSGFTITGGDAQHAIHITNGARPTIDHNVIRDHVTYAFNATAIGSYASDPTIEYNLFLHTRSLGGIGIFSGGGTIQNNTFEDNSRGYWSQGVGVVARNNIVTNSVEFGIGDDGFAINDYNCVWNNNNEYCCGAVPGPNDLNVDPLYCNPASSDHRLSPSSPCAGTGFGLIDRGAFPAGCSAAESNRLHSHPVSNTQ